MSICYPERQGTPKPSRFGTNRPLGSWANCINSHFKQRSFTSWHCLFESRHWWKIIPSDTWTFIKKFQWNNFDYNQTFSSSAAQHRSLKYQNTEVGFNTKFCQQFKDCWTTLSKEVFWSRKFSVRLFFCFINCCQQKQW